MLPRLRSIAGRNAQFWVQFTIYVPSNFSVEVHTGAGDIETGMMTLLAKGTSESRMVLSLSGGTRTETRNASADVPQGKWVNPNGSSGLYAWHNTLTDAVWFFPILSSLGLSANSASLFSYVGQESWNGINAQHLRVYQLQPGSIATALPMSNLSTMDFYLDSSSLLPLAIAFRARASPLLAGRRGRGDLASERCPSARPADALWPLGRSE